jgi:hypothetical protein
MDVDFASKVGHLPSMDPQGGKNRENLLRVLNQTYFLHLCATEPDTVIPEGKSLLSMIAHSRLTPQTAEPAAQLHERVEKAVHGAFWNEVG